MKYKKIMLVSLVLLAILTIGAVSAADENMTSEELTVEGDSIIESVDNVDSVAESVDNADSVAESVDDIDSVAESVDDIQQTIGDEKEDATLKESQDNEVLNAKKNVTMSFNMPTEICSIDEFFYFDEEVEFNHAVTGNIKFYIDGTEFKQADDEDPWIYFELSDLDDFGLSYGSHNWELKYLGNTNYNPSSLKGTFVYTYMEVDFPEYVSANNPSFGVRLPEDCEGYITLYINGAQKYKKEYNPYDYSEGTTFPITGLTSYGNYTYKIVHSGDATYSGATKNGTFEYGLFSASFLDTYIDYGQSTSLDLSFPEDITGYVEIDINNNFYKKIAATDLDSITISEFNIGNNTVTVKYLGSTKYPEYTWSGIVTTAPKIYAADTISFTDSLEVSLALPKNAKGKLIVTIDDKKVGEQGFANGKALIKLSNLSMKDSNYLKAWYNGTDYEVESIEFQITVNPKIVLPDFNTGITYVSVEYPSDATGNLRIILDGDDLDVNFKNGKAKVDLSNIITSPGMYDFNIIYSGNYPSFDEWYNIDVYEFWADIKVTLPDKVIAGNPINIVFTLPSDAGGTIEVPLPDGSWKTVTVSKGKATLTGVKFSRAGTFTVNYDYWGDGKYELQSGSFTVNVIPQAKITGSALTMTYSDGSAFKVRVFDSSGKAVGAGKLVTFKINGKKVASKKTDKKGYASFKPNKTPGSYKITATALGVTITKTLKVKQILKLKAIKIKKSAKKLVLKATLAKVKGKYLKGKVIAFKFNGKTYKVKTNKKGVAQKTFNKKFIKKLKVGKTIKYQATYLKVTIKKSAKVKK